MITLLLLASLSWASDSSDYRDGYMAYEAGHFRDAIRILARVDDNKFPSIQFLRGIAFECLKQYPDAVRTFQRYVSLDKGSSTLSCGQAHLAYCLVHAGQTPEALRVLKKVPQDNCVTTQLIAGLALLQIAERSSLEVYAEQSVLRYQYACHLDNQSAEALNGEARGRMLMATLDPDQSKQLILACQLFCRAIAYKAVPVYFNNLGVAQYRLGNFKGAIKAWQRGLADPEVDEALITKMTDDVEMARKRLKEGIVSSGSCECDWTKP